MSFKPFSYKTFECNHKYYDGKCRFGYHCFEYQDYLQTYHAHVKQDCIHTDEFSYCKLGDACKSAKDRKAKKEKQLVNKYYNRKSILCTNTEKYGFCKDGEHCVYAHSLAERNEALRKEHKDEKPIPNCREFTATGKCSMERCKFIHIENRDELIAAMAQCKCNELEQKGICIYLPFCKYNHDPNFVPPIKDESSQKHIDEFGKIVQAKASDSIVIKFEEDSDEEEEEDEIESLSEKFVACNIEKPIEEQDAYIEAIRAKAMQNNVEVYRKVVNVETETARDRLLPLQI